MNYDIKSSSEELFPNYIKSQKCNVMKCKPYHQVCCNEWVDFVIGSN